jgi:hypothetical protein
MYAWWENPMSGVKLCGVKPRGCPFIEKKIIDKFDKFLQFIDKFR